MAVSAPVVKGIAHRYNRLQRHLNERQRRLWAGAEADAIGHGGITAVSRATGMSPNTVRTGLRELRGSDEQSAPPATQRSRRPGSGRPTLTSTDPQLLDALDKMVEPATRGDPQSPLRWTSKSTQNLSQALTEQGHSVSARTVATLLKEQDYSLQSTRKRYEGRQHPDRDAQFCYLAQCAQAHLDRGQPVVSVDTKKKELVGNFKNGGHEWHPSGEPVEVSAYDFRSLAMGKAVPYGIYDVHHNEGWVSVGQSADTAEFAVQTLRTWWEQMGKARYPDATELLITADSGGSNGYRPRLWKWELQGFCNETSLKITVLHYPPGTSKWNRIEHRMFNHITMNWRGRPLTSFETVVECIADTSTSSGLTIHAARDEDTYETGIKITDREMAQLNISRHQFHGEWNYTFSPQK